MLDTSDPQEALRIATQQAIHLLLTDFVMPLMKGTELARRLDAISPQTKVLLMSGYTPGEVDASRRPFIAKPFTIDALPEKVRQVLDGGSSNCAGNLVSPLTLLSRRRHYGN